MYVTKRDGRKEQVKFEKISKRITRASKDLKNVDPLLIAQKVIQGMSDGISSVELDKHACDLAYSMTIQHPDYDKLATRLAITALHKDTPSTFSECIDLLNESRDAANNPKPIIDPEVTAFIKKNAHIINAAIDSSRDFDFDYFGFKTLERSYLLRSTHFENSKKVVLIRERPQYLWMRVACGIHSKDIDAALNTYQILSKRFATHATPTLYNCGLKQATKEDPKGSNQLSSCFLMGIEEDSISGIFKTLGDVATISKYSGGIGLWAHNVRSKGAPIYGTNGTSDGIIPMLKVFNETARYVNQGSKRSGSFAIYISPENPQIFEFLDLRKNNGKEEFRARSLNLALWCSDLFFKRVEADLHWTLMDPSICPNLENTYGEEFEALYESYEKAGKGSSTIQARTLFSAIIAAMIEGGMPYILSKDSANRHSNQKNLGVIKSSNLCIDGEALVKVKKDMNDDSEEFLLSMKEINDLLPNQNLYVYSFNELSNEKIYNKILNSHLTNEYAEVIKLTFDGKTLMCTPDHKIYTKNRGYVEAQFLEETDELLKM